MKVENIRFGRVVKRLPMKTLVQNTAPPFKYILIKGGFLNSIIPTNASHIRYDIAEAEDGSFMAYIDR